jgi:hypothetical protein
MENSSENFCAVRKSSPLLKGISDEFMIAKTRSRNLLALQLLYEVFKLTEIARAVVKTPHNVLMVYIRGSQSGAGPCSAVRLLRRTMTTVVADAPRPQTGAEGRMALKWNRRNHYD